MIRTAAVTAMLACALIACGGDAEARPDSAGVPEPRVVRMSDAGIMGTLDAINSSEIAAAQLASKKASSADVRVFADQIIRDHQAMQRSGRAFAQQHDITSEQTIDAAAIRARGKSLLDTLATLSGSSFDLTYVDAQVNDHQMALQTLHGWQRNADDADLRGELRTARPVVQAHYDHALALLPGLIPGGEPSVWKKHLGMPDAAQGKPAPQKLTSPTP
jgi:putative membrane protein